MRAMEYIGMQSLTVFYMVEVAGRVEESYRLNVVPTADTTVFSGSLFKRLATNLTPLQ